MTNTQNEKLLKAEAVGKMLSLSKRQIFRLNSSGKIPAALRINGSVRWSSTSLLEWISMGCPDRQTFEARQEVAR